MEQSQGYRAPVYRALFTPRLSAGIPRDLCHLYWGALSLPIFCVTMGWKLKSALIAVALLGHLGMVILGQKNPYWYDHLRRKLRHADVYTRRSGQSRTGLTLWR
jgi:type IV secretory pathway TrbD component